MANSKWCRRETFRQQARIDRAAQASGSPLNISISSGSCSQLDMAMYSASHSSKVILFDVEEGFKPLFGAQKSIKIGHAADQNCFAEDSRMILFSATHCCQHVKQHRAGNQHAILWLRMIRQLANRDTYILRLINC